MIGLEQRVMEGQVNIRESVLLFTEKARHDYDVERLILFGSRARGDHTPDSDVDVAVILRGKPGDYVDTRLKLAGLAYDVLLETGARIQAHPVWVSEWSAPESYSNPQLLKNIAEDGNTLWSYGCDGAACDQPNPRPIHYVDAETGLVSADLMVQAFRITKRELASAVGLGVEAITRSERVRSPKVQARLREAAEVLSRARPWAGSEAASWVWYRSTSIPSLGDLTPEELVARGQSDDVMAYLNHLVDGGFA